MWRIKDWEQIYERGDKRIRRMEYVLVPNKHDGYGFRSVMAEEDGTSILGAWLLLLQVASKANPRGYLVRSTGEAHTAVTIAKMTGSVPGILERAFEVLSLPEIGWIEITDDDIEGLVEVRRPEAAEEGKRQHARVDRLMKSGGIFTPAGPVTSRPATCQWCGRAPDRPPANMPGVVARHLTPPANHLPPPDKPLVIFVCRTCQASFENGKFSLRMIFERFGTDWIPHLPPPDISPDTTCQPPATLTDARARIDDETLPDLTRPDLTTTGGHLPPATNGHPPEQQNGSSSSSRIKIPDKSFDYVNPPPPANPKTQIDQTRVDRMRLELQKYMTPDSKRELVTPPDDGIVLRCLNAIGDTDMDLVHETLRTLRNRNDQAPGNANGPKTYAWFPATLANIFSAKGLA
jgi:hypothetical protein